MESFSEQMKASKDFLFSYQLCGSDLQKLCMHNAFIAKAVSRRRLACTWRMIGLLCSLSPFFEVNDYKIQSDNRRSSNEGINHIFPAYIQFRIYFFFFKKKSILKSIRVYLQICKKLWLVLLVLIIQIMFLVQRLFLC